MNNKDKYLNIFSDTVYQVFIDDKIYTIELNKNNKWIDDLLRQEGHWAFITAFNPLPHILSTQENIKRNNRLKQDIINSGYVFFAGFGKGKDNWKEESFLIINISKNKAIELAKKYNQMAIIAGRKGKKAKLLFL